ncbi:hypothetical protein [Bifidobacterium oedipodis]|uniref:K structural protein n=1 Tax=Bifidobacterium oedipodis TaxID=2675322 RepID=A0A7Y0EP69_9BIFI|nr:hypothetical protein [Bifidobacterium sp. DSM 109957]NMM93876.1 K structural protein [Bifidobacterium sp. DSM 109957]
MVQQIVSYSGVVTHKDDKRWRFSEQDGGVVSVTIAPALFNPTDTAKRDKYLTGVGDEATVVWINSGIPLARVNSGEYEGLFGPYDPDATDGRQEKIWGLLESQIECNVKFSGLTVGEPMVGMRYRGDIRKRYLPVIPADDAVWGGDFWDIDEDNTIIAKLSLTEAGGSSQATVPDGSITTAKLANGAVTTEKLADKAVTAAKVADGVIPSGK